MSRSASWPMRRTPLGESASARPSASRSRPSSSSSITWRRFWKSCIACWPSSSRRSSSRDVVEVARHQVLLELLHALHLAHQLERLLVVEALGAVEQMLVALAEVFQVADVLVLLEQRLEIGARLGVLELVALELANRLREPARDPLQLAQLLARASRPLCSAFSRSSVLALAIERCPGAARSIFARAPP